MKLHLSQAIRHWAMNKSDMTAIITDRTISYAQLNNGANYVAGKIKQLNNVNNAVILVKDKALFVSAIAGCVRAGIVYSLINYNRFDEYIEVLAQLNYCDCIISDYLVDSWKPPIQMISINILIFDNSYIVDDSKISLSDESCIIFTSGTTNTPKGVVRSQYSVLSEAILWIIDLKLRQGTRFLISRPFYYTGGYVLMYSTLFVGGTIVTDNHDDVLKLYGDAINNPCDIAFITPNQITDLINSHKDNPKFFTKAVLTMGSPISPRTKKVFNRSFNCEVIEAWGNSEGLGTITSNEDTNENPSTIGKACFCDEMFVLDTKGNKLGVNEIGLLAGYSDNQFDRYLSIDPDQTCINDKDLIISEDVGYFDRNGNFYLLGRVSDMINKNGTSIYPISVEKYLMNNEDIRDCALQVTNIDNKEILCLCIVADLNSRNKIISSIKDDKDMRDKNIDFILFMDFIPRNAGGKIERKPLATFICEKMNELVSMD